MTTDPNTVVITIRDVYDQLVALRKEVSGVPSTVADHETRIRSLEHAKHVTRPEFYAAILTALTALGVLAAFLAVK